MLEQLNLSAEVAGSIIGFLTELPLDEGKKKIFSGIQNRILIRRIKTRAEYLNTQKYSDIFKKYDSYEYLHIKAFWDWLSEKGTLKTILSFCHTENIENVSREQLFLSREDFYLNAFKMADTENPQQREIIKALLNDIFRYTDSLLWDSLDGKDRFLLKRYREEISSVIHKETKFLAQKIEYTNSFAEYIDSQKIQQKTAYYLDYRSGKIPFYGREKEFEELDAFCNSPELISWWAVIAGGGSGKSRLLYEYISSRNSNEWKMLFLNEEFFHQENSGGKYQSYSRWTYNRNLFLVIDYVQRYAKETAQWLESLINNNTVSNKFRILLLEREGNKDSLWVKDIFDNSRLETFLYGDFYYLEALNPEQYISLAQEYAAQNNGKVTALQAEEAYKHLIEIDENKRILYYIMVIDATMSGRDWRNWSLSDLMDYIVKREIKMTYDRFKKIGAREAEEYIKLSAFCTATRYINLESVPEDLPNELKQSVQIIRNSCHNRDEFMGVMLAANFCMYPVTPDLVGEYFTLYMLQQYMSDKKACEKFIQNAWNYSPHNFMFFIYRLRQDGVGNKMTDAENIIEQMTEEPPTDKKEVLVTYCRLMWGLIPISLYSDCLLYIEKLKNIYLRTSDHIFATEYAKGLFNLTVVQDTADERLRTVERLQELAAGFPADREITLVYAKGLFNLTVVQDTADERLRTVERLQELAAGFPADREITLVYAQGLVNLTVVQDTADERLRTVERLQELAAGFPADREITLEYAKGLVNLTAVQDTADERLWTVERLQELAAGFPADREITLVYAKGLMNLTAVQDTADERLRTVERLQELAAGFPADREITLVYAQGLMNLTAVQDTADERLRTVERLQELAAGFPADREITLVYAKGLFNLLLLQETDNDILKTTKKLHKISDIMPDNCLFISLYICGLIFLSAMQNNLERKDTFNVLKNLLERKSTVSSQNKYAYISGFDELRNYFDINDVNKINEKLQIIKPFLPAQKAFEDFIVYFEKYYNEFALEEGDSDNEKFTNWTEGFYNRC